MRPLLSLVLPSLAGVALAGGGVVAATGQSHAPVPASKPSAPAKPRAASHPDFPPRPSFRDGDEGLYDPSAGLLKRGPREERTLVLTFDDGPHPSSAEPLLDILKKLDVKATFFVVGERVKMHPDLVRRMIAEGHEVGNHTQDHVRLHDLSPFWLKAELSYCETNVRRATGRGMTLMRPPGMRYNAAVLAEARAQGYITIGYNNVAGDYVPNGGVSDMTPEESVALGLDRKTIADRVERQFKPGTIILLHDNPVTVEAVPDIIARARAQGYRFVTTAEMLASLPEPVRVVANPPVKR